MDIPIEIDVTEAARLHQSPDSILLDVREPRELAFSRIDGSLAIPMGAIAERLAEIPRDQRVLVMCHHGGRSMQVTQFLRSHGYAMASNIAGGIDAWAEIVDPALPRY